MFFCHVLGFSLGVKLDTHKIVIEKPPNHSLLCYNCVMLLFDLPLLISIIVGFPFEIILLHFFLLKLLIDYSKLLSAIEKLLFHHQHLNP